MKVIQYEKGERGVYQSRNSSFSIVLSAAISSISSLKEQLLKISKKAMKEYMRAYFSATVLAKDWSFVNTAKLVTGKTDDEDGDDGMDSLPT